MQQVNNGFCDYYYLTIEGKVYNTKSQKYLKIDNHNYILMTTEGKARKISLKNLYKLVYNKVYCIDNIENLQDEQWKIIANTNDNYYISNYGRVKSYANYNASLLQQKENNKGYFRVMITEQGKSKHKYIHILVAQAFLQKPKYKDYEVHHIDKNTKNNNVNNLMYVTIEEHYNIHYGKKETKGE